MKRLRRFLIYINKEYHMLFHLLFSSMALVLFLNLNPEALREPYLILIVIALVTTMIPDFDHILFMYVYGRNSEYAIQARSHLAKRDISGFIKHVKEKHKNNHGIYSHNAGTMLLVLLLSYLMQENIYLSLFFLVWAFHYIYDMLEDLLVFGRLNGNWFFKFSKTDISQTVNKILYGGKVMFMLIRVKSQILNSWTIVFGYILAKGFILHVGDVSLLLKTVLVFSIIFYGGIYTFNDVMDVELDRKHPHKRKGRAIAAGMISKRKAEIIAFVLVIAGLILGLTISKRLFEFQILYLVYNITYTFWAKKTKYADIFVNGLTHPTRSIMGIVLAGGAPVVFVHYIITHFLTTVATTTQRRYRELYDGNLESRPVLKKYSKKSLEGIQISFLGVALLHLLLTLNTPGIFFRIVMLLAPTLLACTISKKSPFKTIVEAVYYGKSDKKIKR